MTKVRHKWFLGFDDHVPKQLTKYPASDRIAIFRAIAELLKADNPAAVPGVKKMVETQYAGLYRQRQGDYRILFAIEHGEIVHLKSAYKGRLYLDSVIHRRDL
jgi:mRNA-degrading endonuclease RelE of RelBE toxin-antitoxin system